MVGASNFLKVGQECITGSSQTDKCAFSEARSDDVLDGEKSSSNPPDVADSLDSVDSISSKQSPEEAVESKQCGCLQDNVITMFTIIFAIAIKLLLFLDGFISDVSVGVKENKHARFGSGAGSSELSSSVKNKLPVRFYELLNGDNFQVFKVSAVEEAIETDIVDILDDEDVVVSETVLVNDILLKEGKNPVTPSVFLSSSEDNVKQTAVGDREKPSNFSNVLQLQSPEVVTNTCFPKVCFDNKTLNLRDSNAASEVTIDTICFPFVANSSSISISIEGHTFRCLVDTGAAITAVSAYVWNEYLHSVCPNLVHPDLENVTSVNGEPLSVLGKAMIKFTIESEVFPFQSHVISGLTYDVILGRDFLSRYSSKIDFEKGIIRLISSVDPLPFCNEDVVSFADDVVTDDSFLCSVHADFSFIIPPHSEVIVPAELDVLPKHLGATGMVIPRCGLAEKYSVFAASELVHVSDVGTIPMRIINPSSQPVKIFRRTRLGDFEEVVSSIATFELNELNSQGNSRSPPSATVDSAQRDYSNLPDLSDADKIKFRDLFHNYRDVFAFSDDQLGRTSLVQHTIDTGDALPIKQRPYRTTPENKQEIDRQVKDMLERGIIQESVSPWSSPVVLVKKKNGEMRFCIDFRMINKIAKKDSFPMPLVSDTLDALSGTNYFTTLDLKSGYWQIDMHPSSREKTAFVTHNGLYEFLVMPFGLTNSGASFQRLMGHVLRGLEYRFALIYIDDIIIFSKSVDEHLAHLEEVFRRLRDANVKLNPKKCSFVK